MTIAALIDPAVERIYGVSTRRVVLGEWEYLCRLLGLGDVASSIETLGHNDYLVVDCAGAPDEMLRAAADLTTIAAIYAYEPPDTLRVVTTERPALLPSSILTIQRYRGKTNERFTRMMLSLALAAVDRLNPDATAAVFDPMAGRGTTLNAAVHRGLGAGGVEIDARDHREYVNFLATWLKDNRLKHRLQKAHERSAGGERLPSVEVTYARTREDFKAGRTTEIKVVAGNALEARRWFAKGSYDCLVTDLPYGVQHGAHHRAQRERSKAHDWTSPGELLERGLPVWRHLLRPRAAVACSWNLRTLDRDVVVEALKSNGFDVVGGDDDSVFEHRVDHSIQRDLVIATRSP